MDASAYLRNQGWRGAGHSLDHTDRGITKPLLVSKKIDVLGLGLNKHKAVSDQWWMRAFDQGLKSLGTGQESALAQVQKHGVHRGGLYANFVKGERFEGSIGPSVLPTPEDSEGSGEKETAQSGNLTVGKMSQKRKRDPDEQVKERPKEKRARRKYERAEKQRVRTAEKRVEDRQKAIVDGTYDEKAEAEKILARKRERDVNKQANDFIVDAQRRGIIPYGPNEIRQGLIPTGANATFQGEPSQDLLTVLTAAGIDPANPVKVTGSVKAQKYARMKLQREVKRAAKAYLMGETLPLLPASKEERKRLRKEQRKKNAPTGLEKAQKNAERLRAHAEKTAANVEKNQKRKEGRERKREEKQVIDQIIAERDAEKSDGDRLTKSQKIDPAAFDNDADEIKLGLSKKGTLKKIPGVGVVDKYPSQGEKKAKKLQAEAIKAELGDEEMARRVNENRASKYGLDTEKLDQYQQRAAAKGLTLSEYVDRRKQKKQEVEDEKQKAKVLKMWDGVEGELIVDDSNLPKMTKVEPGQPDETTDDGSDQDDDSNEEGEDEEEDGGVPLENFGFVVDTAGDEKLEFKVSDLKDSYKNKPKPTEVISDLRDAQAKNIPISELSVISPKVSEPTQLASKAIAAINEERPFTVHDAEGNTTLHWQPGTPIPPDPRIWEGVVVKELPRKIRDARKRFLVLRREERKAAQDPNYRKVEKKARGARKIEAREKFLHAILHNSREALLRNGKWGGYAEVSGREDVPLVQVESKEGKFSKFETSLARTVARRIQRDEKRAERAKEGRGKGWKKRERSEKQARIERGISGFVDKWRKE